MLDLDRIDPPDPATVLRHMREARDAAALASQGCAQLLHVAEQTGNLPDVTTWSRRMAAAHRAHMALYCEDLGGEE